MRPATGAAKHAAGHATACVLPLLPSVARKAPGHCTVSVGPARHARQEGGPQLWGRVRAHSYGAGARLGLLRGAVHSREM